MNRRAGLGCIFLILVLCLLSASVSAGAVDVGEQMEVDNQDAFSVNESDRHENPDEAMEDGDDEAVESWLGGWFGGALGDTGVEISEEEYDLARNLVGDEYDERLGQYVEVTGDTETGESLNQTKSEFERFIELLEEFEATEAAYQQALEEGDEELAREHARELVEIAEELDGVSRSLDELLAEIEEVLDIDLSEVTETTSSSSTDRQSRSEAVTDAEFEETVLAIEPQGETISFVSPLEADGTLETVDGEPVANEPIELVVGEQNISVETDENGAFSLTYRPVTIPLTTEELAVEYIPGAAASYQGNETNVSVTVEQVDPTITVTTDIDEGGFGDEVALNGTLEGDGTPVDAVELDVSIGGEVLDTVSVSDGSFDSTVSIPSSIAPGESDVGVQLPFEEQALASVNATEPITILETDTELTATATVSEEPTEDADGEVSVTGNLTTADGTPLAGEPLTIQGETDTVTVETADDGTFESTLPVKGAAETQEQSLTIRYDGAGNLQQTEETVAVEIAGYAPPTESGLDTLTILAGGVSVLLGGLLIGGWWYRRSGDDGTDQSTERTDRVPDPPMQSSEPQPGNEVSIKPLLEEAHSHLDEGEADNAVKTGYTATRTALADEIETTTPITHREFFSAYEASTNGDQRGTVDSLETITDAYERAAYGPDTVSVAEATETLSVVEEVCSKPDSVDT